jgi:hypothetical protein
MLQGADHEMYIQSRLQQMAADGEALHFALAARRANRANAIHAAAHSIRNRVLVPLHLAQRPS